MGEDGKLDRQLGVRLSDDDFERLDALAERLGQRSHAVARACVRIGLSALEADPAKFISADAREKLAKTSKKSKRSK